MSDQIYVVRGSGTRLDGALVKMDTEWERVDGEYIPVHSVTGPTSQYPILVHERHLQEVEDRLKRYNYTFTVTKTCLEDKTTQQDFVIIDNALRNMNVRTILGRIESELGPILRLE
jgi:hypothetical protein